MEIVDEKKINFDLIEDLLIMLLNKRQMNTSIVAPNGDGGMDTRMDDGSVLIFLPGIGEIRALYQRLSTSKILGNKDQFNIISMHSSISSKEQKRAFVPQKMGCKIILATNICEASLTIPDCVVVIDTGLERSIKQNNRTSTPTLVTDWCSKASAKQRAGRVSFKYMFYTLFMHHSHNLKLIGWSRAFGSML
jgi:HrpA-like RNA helicase